MLQSSLPSNEKAESILKDAANRIQSMIVLYDKIYRHDSFYSYEY
jgi:two-component sensor histidine kinase